jgi:hypothetical protein
MSQQVTESRPQAWRISKWRSRRRIITGEWTEMTTASEPNDYSCIRYELAINRDGSASVRLTTSPNTSNWWYRDIKLLKDVEVLVTGCIVTVNAPDSIIQSETDGFGLIGEDHEFTLSSSDEAIQVYESIKSSVGVVCR